MLAKNKSGLVLLEYLTIEESKINEYDNVTGAYAIISVNDKFRMMDYDICEE